MPPLLSLILAVVFLADPTNAVVRLGDTEAGSRPIRPGYAFGAADPHPRPVYDVRDYGARGDGLNDETSAIQSAAIAARERGGGVLYFPAGIYMTRQFLIGDRTWVKGDGADATILRSAETGRRGLITNEDHLTGNHHLSVSDLTIERTVTDDHGFHDHIFFENCRFVRVTHVRVVGAATGPTAPVGNKGITVEASRHILILHNEVRNVSDNSIAVTWRGTRSTGLARIADNLIEVPGTWNHSGIIVTADHSKIVGNVLAAPPGGTATLIELGDDVRSVLVQGNSAVHGGLLTALSGGWFRIIGNRALGGGINLSSVNGQQSRHTLVDNDIVEGNIRLKREGEADFSGVLLARNRVARSTADFGIKIEGVGHVTAVGNVVRDCENGGFGVFPGERPNVVIRDNVARANGRVASGGNGDRAGFYFEGPAAEASGLVIRTNVAVGNPGPAYFFEQPQGYVFIRNEGEENGRGLIGYGNPTLRGEMPFLFVDMAASGSPEGVVFASPGSLYERVDVEGAMYVKLRGTGSTGWWPR